MPDRPAGCAYPPPVGPAKLANATPTRYVVAILRPLVLDATLMIVHQRAGDVRVHVQRRCVGGMLAFAATSYGTHTGWATATTIDVLMSTDLLWIFTDP